VSLNKPLYFEDIRVTALAGGVGGAKLAHGLAMAIPPDHLSVIVNTGDDFDFLGLRICPDLDTVCYTLAGIANPLTGWGQADESWNMLDALSRLGGPSWFRVGDRDLATHLERTRRLAAGEPLSAVTRAFCQSFGINTHVLPMTDDPCSTWVETEEMGWLAFQEYFVHQACRPRVKSFRFEGKESAFPAPGVLDAIETADLVIICPSNPWVSIGPILALPEMIPALQSKMVWAVSPIVGGQTIKGPAAKMFSELGIDPSPLAVAEFYGNELLDGLVMDHVDESYRESIEAMQIDCLVTDSIMRTIPDRRRFAVEILKQCGVLNKRQETL
jgi:LPPG:FO 2-phospho-L-lactate transferase